MRSKARRGARDVREWLERSVLDHWLLRDWYWRLRRRVYPKTRRRFGDVTAEFRVTQPQDLVYHEFDSESPVLEDLLSELADDDVFYDIGANIGLYACVTAQVLDPGNVVAFEPSPPAYELLRENVALNGDRIHAYRIALSDTDSRVEFAVDVGGRQSRMSTLNADNPRTDVETTRVQARRLASVLDREDVPPPTLVKIDVEGAEHDVLRGMGPHLEEVRVLYCELHHPVLSDFGTTGGDVRAFLRSAGFTVERFAERDENEFLKAVR